MYSPFQLTKKYIRYYFTASNGKGHGIHSPFVFDFIKFVLNDRKNYSCYETIEAARENLLSNRSLIDVEDFGAGSAVIKTNKRIIAKIAASSLKPKKFSQLLFRISQYYKPATIVELGTSFGISSAYLACANPAATVYTLEGAGSIAAIATKNFEQLNLQNIHLLGGDFRESLPLLFRRIKNIDLVFLDGNHRKEPTLQYFSRLLDYAVASTLFIFDDIHWSREMEEAWTEVQQDSRVTLTIDLFFIGLVFINPEFKEKQHFKIRF
ncbi:MAG: class I SAM-dependent methyltransferase [Ferruginibacter sp.]|nr:class I SAM-dependent methyltransferase [Ferruginibacter sp.]